MNDEQEKAFESEHDLTHIIFEDGSFRKNLDRVIEKWQISGFDYNVMAILGPQSSGKSTLLNGLFSTSFPTMVSEDGRYQCTKGIWLGKSAKSNTLVLDVEGTDGRERGEAEVAFEKKTSLFSLALAEILIVNMWMQDVGRNNAANLPLLKTVFEINLQLFQHEKRSKTLLLFVIRDHVKQVTPLDKLVSIIEKDLAEIWAGIAKPEQYKTSRVNDFFEFQFTSLPHKVLEGDKFQQDLAELSRRFNDASHPQYVWSKALKKNVPADGLPMFAEKVWEAIQANKDLDLPSQREILATFRCDEISASALATFKSALEEGLQAKIVGRKKAVEDMGTQGDALMETAIASYDQLASRYFDEVVNRKRDALVAAMLSQLKDIWNTNAAIMFEEATLSFEASLQKTFRELAKKAASEQTMDFGLTVTALKKEALSTFEKRMSQTVPSRAGWSFSLQLEQLDTAMSGAVEHEREKQLNMVMDQAMSAVEAYGDAVTDLLELGRPSMWSDIRELYADEQASGKQRELRGRLQTLQMPESDIEERLQEVAAKKLSVTRRRAELQQERVGQRMQKVFDEVFRMDGSMPRVWKPEVPLESIYEAAVAKGAEVLELYTVLRLSAADDELRLLDSSHKVPQDKMLMTRAKADSIMSNYKGATANACAEAQRAIDNYGKASSTPLIMSVLIVILGFNEFMWLISNPFMLFLVITLLSGAYAVHAMGMTPIVLPVIKAAYDQALAQINAIINGGAAVLQQHQQLPAKSPAKQSKPKKE